MERGTGLEPATPSLEGLQAAGKEGWKTLTPKAVRQRVRVILETIPAEDDGE